MANSNSRTVTQNSDPRTSGPDWALVLCPLCQGRGAAALITLRGTGETDEDPVIFPAHRDCLDRDTPATTVITAMRAAGAETTDDVKNDPAMAAAVLRIIGENYAEATQPQ